MNRPAVETVQRESNLFDVTQRSYDFAGNLKTLQDPAGKIYSYEYDALNRKIRATYPLDANGVARFEAWTYDPAGNVATYRNRAGAIQTFISDNRNRRTNFWWSDGTSGQTTQYDLASRVTRIYNFGGWTGWNYFNDNSVQSETQLSYGDHQARTVSYTYDPDGKRLTIGYPMGLNLTYLYNQRQQIVSINDTGAPPSFLPAVKYLYDPDGNLTQRTLRHGTRTDYASADSLNRIPALQTYFGGAGSARFDYAFDPVSQRKYEQRNSGPADGYSYDLTGQVKGFQRDGTLQANGTVIGGATQTSLNYDPNGNRTSVVTNGAPTNYAASDTNQYSAINGVGLGYDGNENLTEHNGWRYTYDAQNRMVGAEHVATATRVVFYYDGLNRQIARDVTVGAAPMVRTYHVWDGWKLLEERDNASNVKNVYLHGARMDEIVVRFGGGQATRWYSYDGRGNVSHLTDDWNNLIERYTYDLAGTPTCYNGHDPQSVSASISGNRFLFTGREYMPESGLYDYRHRMYHPTLGRFMQMGPIGMQFEGEKLSSEAAALYRGGEKAPEKFTASEVNLYRYCHNDPINKTDPMGLIGVYAGDKYFEKATITVVYDPKTSKGTLTVTGQNKGDKTPTELLKGRVVVGGDGHVTPTGKFTASYWEKDHVSKAYGSLADTPWSKTRFGGNAFGPYQLHIKQLESRGIYIHGTMGPGWSNMTSISGLMVSETSHGCVRMGNADIINLHKMMPEPGGNQVIISAGR